MSSESSTSSIRQFGLYRTIDARTEEFLRLSRKRQLRQGCICAAISTAITVIVVIMNCGLLVCVYLITNKGLVVLLIYEYLIVVETNAVQNIQSKYKLNKDQPMADRLDRSYFGFDQDYFERMPLLVNALQENSYIDPTGENISVLTLRKKQKSQINNAKPVPSYSIYKSVHKTTPQPFIFEYRSPNPSPFSKSFNSRSWVESYRNAQRLKNLNQVIKYLEKTLHAKFGDVYEPSTAQIAFSGVYVAPIENKKSKPAQDSNDWHGSQKVQYQYNHVSDPLFVFKPDNPGDINLLADGYRFSPMFTSHTHNLNQNVPMFRPIGYNKRKCVSAVCDMLSETQDKDSIDLSSKHSNKFNKPKSFGVMLNWYPIHTQNSYSSSDLKRTSSIDQIYITTVRPSFQFKKKQNNISVRRTSFRPKIPKMLAGKRYSDISTTQTTPYIETTTVPQVIVHFNVYSVRKRPTLKNNLDNNEVFTSSTTIKTTTTATEVNKKYGIQLPVISSSIVEDYHDGSSGVIPVQERTPSPSTYPITTPIVPQFNQRHYSSESTSTNPPDVMKFSPEDAKIPDEYLNVRKSDISMMNESDLDEKYVEENIQFDEKPKHDAFKEIEKSKTLVIKLKNILKTTTALPTTAIVDETEEDIRTSTEETVNIENTEEEEEDYKANTEETITVDNTKEDDYKITTERTGETYVPMINGHYRSTKRKTLNILFNENSEKYRKKRLETSIAFQRSTYVPMYVEIKRNQTITSIKND